MVRLHALDTWFGVSLSLTSAFELRSTLLLNFELRLTLFEIRVGSSEPYALSEMRNRRIVDLRKLAALEMNTAGSTSEMSVILARRSRQ